LHEPFLKPLRAAGLEGPRLEGRAAKNLAGTLCKGSVEIRITGAAEGIRMEGKLKCERSHIYACSPA
jgi:hypothetical protein